MQTIMELRDKFKTEVMEHLELEEIVPVIVGFQRQGDIAIYPTPARDTKNLQPIPAEGVIVVRGENGGNTHTLLADINSGVLISMNPSPSVNDLVLGTLVVPEGKVAYLSHPEHGFNAIGEGTYNIKRQRQQSDVERFIAD